MEEAWKRRRQEERADEPEVGSSTGLRAAAVKPFETSEVSEANSECRRAAEALKQLSRKRSFSNTRDVLLLRSPEDTIINN